MEHANIFPVKKRCLVLSVSKSGYYHWRIKAPGLLKKKEQEEEEIRAIFNSSRRTYGNPRIADKMNRETQKLSESTIARRMRALGLSPALKKKYKNTTDSKHNKAISPNILNRKFKVEELGRYWLSDITYIRVQHSFVYLTTIMDLADRMVFGWSLSNNMTDQDMVMATFNKAIETKPISTDLVFHSDRGSQYASNDFRDLLANEKCIQSMSRKGNYWDNAVAESFFKTIKTESLYLTFRLFLKWTSDLIFSCFEGCFLIIIENFDVTLKIRKNFT
jgi:putative transposase